MRLAVFGATGPTGQILVRKALAAGHEVTAYARNPAKLERAMPGLTVVAGELTNADAIAQVVAGKDAVISVLGPKGRAPHLPIAAGTRRIVEAMRRHGVKRLIATTTPSAPDANDRFRLSFWLALRLIRTLIGSAYREILATAEVIRASELDWTIARVPVLSNKEAELPPAAGYVGDPRIKLFFLSRNALAEFLLAQLTERAWSHCAPVISNG